MNESSAVMSDTDYDFNEAMVMIDAFRSVDVSHCLLKITEFDGTNSVIDAHVSLGELCRHLPYMLEKSNRTKALIKIKPCSKTLDFLSCSNFDKRKIGDLKSLSLLTLERNPGDIQCIIAMKKDETLRMVEFLRRMREACKALVARDPYITLAGQRNFSEPVLDSLAALVVAYPRQADPPPT